MNQPLASPSIAQHSAVQTHRSSALDALRGAAMVWMVLFHLAYDLNHFGWLQPRQQFLTDPFWTWQRVCIVAGFMFCAGVSQAAAQAQGQGWLRFGRRWGQIALCAGLVSLATWVVFPRSWIAFGVLHGLAVMVVLARIMAAWPRPVLAVLACTALVLPALAQHPVLDAPAWQWLGLVTRKPVTEDYAPLFPWFGMVLLGVVLGPRFLTVTEQRGRAARVLQRGPARLLAAWGRWPLTVYMVHQPLLWGLLLLLPRQ